MTTTLAPEARRNIALFSGVALQSVHAPKFSRRFGASGTGVLVVKGMPVFRSGAFRDSFGYQHTWEDLHMTQMVDNFDLLLQRGIFSDVPVRADHPSFFSADRLKGLIGYHSGLATEQLTNPVDSQDYVYVLADFEVMDPEAQPKVESGLWRNVSAEVGTYLSNDEAEYWPAYMGVAYVDISAVEGLRTNGFRAAGAGTAFSVLTENEGDINVSGAAGGGGATGSTFAFMINGKAGKPFSTNGLSPDAVAEFARAQQHITVLEEFQKETQTQGRKDFVAQLVSDKKLIASQKEATEVFALGLAPEQFTAWRATWENAPQLSLLGTHAAGGTSAEGVTVLTDREELEDQLAVQRGIVQHHRNAGTAEDKVKELPSFKKMTELEKQLGALTA